MPLQDFAPTQTITNPVIPGGSAGNILFFGSGGAISQSTSLFWDNANTTLKLGPSATGKLQYPTTNGPFNILVAEATFNGVIDSVLYWGYNQGRSTATEPSYVISMESHYWNLTQHLMEVNWDYISSDGLTSKRFLTQAIDRVAHTSVFAILEQSQFFLQNSGTYFAVFDKTTQLTSFYDAAGVVKLTIDTTTSPSITLNLARLSNAGTSNLFLGVTSGNFTLSGAQNSGYGGDNMSALTSGGQNAAFGASALSAVTSGSANSAFGHNTLKAISTASNCTAVGSSALSAATGTSNSALGTSAGTAITSGTQNTAMGTSALLTDQTGGNNSAFGFEALKLTTIGSNSAFGAQALAKLTSGSQNDAFGLQALFNNQTGAENAAFGNSTLTACTGSNNTGFGNFTLGNATGNDNTSCGHRAGNTITTGSKNTFLGSGADSSVNNLTLSCAIGYNASFSASSMMALGGTGANTVSVVIGGTTASSRLHVIEKTIESEVFRIESIATNDDPADKFYHGRQATTDATQTTINTVAITASNTYYVEANVRARRTGGTGGTAEDAAGYTVCGTYKTVAGVVTLVGAVTAIYTAEDQAGWDATLDINGTNVRVRVTGAVNNNVVWHSTVKVMNVGT